MVQENFRATLFKKRISDCLSCKQYISASGSHHKEFVIQSFDDLCFLIYALQYLQGGHIYQPSLECILLDDVVRMIVAWMMLSNKLVIHSLRKRRQFPSRITLLGSRCCHHLEVMTFLNVLCIKNMAVTRFISQYNNAY